MIKVEWKKIYKVQIENLEQWYLILYDISANHYVGVPIFSNEEKEYTYLKSINKYASPDKVIDISKNMIKSCVFIKGKPLLVTDKDFNLIKEKCKNYFLKYLDNNITIFPDDYSYLKWCKDHLVMEKDKLTKEKIIQNGIYWINLGYNVGSELRKLRPAILWRSSKDKNMWTAIPLTTKRRENNSYFHVDLNCLAEGTAKIENMINISYKRIVSEYYNKNKLAILTKRDVNNIKKAIKKYYLFE